MRTTRLMYLLLFVAVPLLGSNLAPTDDAYVSSKLENQNFNFGKNAPLVVSGENTAYLKFNLAGLPPGTSADQVSKATLVLWVSKISSPGTFNVRRALGAWTEETITYNTAPALGATEAANVAAEEGSFVHVDVTSLVRDYLNGAANDGVALEANSGFLAEFDSKEHTGTGHEARLDIDVTSLVAGSGISMSGLGSGRTITNTGVTSIAGGTGITASVNTGSVTLDVAGSYRLPQSCANGEIPAWNGMAWACAADSVGSGWGLSGNTGTTPGTHFIGTTDNQSMEFKVNGARALRIEPAAFRSPNIIGGNSSNSVTAGAFGATISGGGNSPNNINHVTDSGGTVGGGVGNRAGNDNSIDDAVGATVGGGAGNTASGGQATVGGGIRNTASGDQATVPGGYENRAEGLRSFAAGAGAVASHRGAFVWSDAAGTTFSSTAVNQFGARALGGVRFVLAVDLSGNELWNCSVVNGGSWACSSDRNLKENIVALNSREVLMRLQEVPIYRWNAKGQEIRVPHFGPMAQDFYAAFGLGEDERHISTIDADGVAFAAIQGLYQVVQEKDAKIASLEARLEALERALAAAPRE